MHLTIFIDALFNHYDYEKIIIDTNKNNARAQHVSESTWENQLGEPQLSKHYELTKNDWLNSSTNKLKYRKD